jgi:hypothetical protein
MPDYGLGRRPAVDPADQRFLMRTLIPRVSVRDRRYWYQNGWWGNQGSEPECVAYAWTHWLEDGPLTQPGPAPLRDPGLLYDEAQREDEWPGEGYDGTSVRAGAKVLQRLGYVLSYHWAWDLQTALDGLFEAGPVVMGTNWYRSMFEPDEEGYIRELTGGIVGGHAWLINGGSRSRGIVRCKNSWGRDWGRGGTFWLPFELLERLIAEDGEAALAMEARLG